MIMQSVSSRYLPDGTRGVSVLRRSASVQIFKGPFNWLGSGLIKLDPEPDRCQFDHRQEVA
jgi:hypothetical protein